MFHVYNSRVFVHFFNTSINRKIHLMQLLLLYVARYDSEKPTNDGAEFKILHFSTETKKRNDY